MQRLAAPPPGGPTPTQSLPLSLRARRPSIPAGGATKPASLTAEAALASLTARSSPNQDGASVHAGEKEQRRFVSSGSAPRSSLFTSQRSRYGSAEQAETIASLQQNVASLSAFNRREKAHNEALKAQIAELSSKCSQLQEAHAEEKTKNEKIAALRRQRQLDGYDDGGLPYIGHAASAAATAAALQQQAQLEVSYQRKVLSLENRCRDLMENNKKLLIKIQQLEETEADAQQQITALQRENERVGTQVDSLTSTVTSQSSLIVGLRKMVSDLNREQQIVSDLTRKLNRCQTDLEATKLREKLLRDEADKARTTLTLEKQALMDKVVDLQRRLQQLDQADSRVQSFEMQITLLRREAISLNDSVASWKDKCSEADERMHQQEQMTNRLLQENRGLEETVIQLRATLSSVEEERHEMEQERASKLRDLEHKLQDTLKTQDAVLSALGAAKDKEISALMNTVVQLQGDLDARDKTTAEQQSEIARLQREIQSLKQLSQDETVQALQLARQKAASQEALVLVEEEKRALAEKLKGLEELYAAEQAMHHRERDKKMELSDRLDASMLVIRQLQEENATLMEKIAAAEEVVERLTTEAEAARAQAEAARAEAETARAEAQAKAVPVIVEAPPPVEVEAISTEEKGQLEAAIAQLKDEYEVVVQQMQELDKEYRKLVTKKYKTESFQNQVQLLQNENSELTSRLEQLFKDLSKERQMVSTLSQELRELKLRAMDPGLVTKLKQTQEALEKTVSALVEAEAASESSFTCMQCMQPFNEPKTLVPCGHTYCSRCLAALGDAKEPSTITCKQCAKVKPHETDGVFPNQALADLTARFLFRQQTLATMATMCLSLRNSFADRSSVAS